MVRGVLVPTNTLKYSTMDLVMIVEEVHLTMAQKLMTIAHQTLHMTMTYVNVFQQKLVTACVSSLEFRTH